MTVPPNRRSGGFFVHYPQDVRKIIQRVDHLVDKGILNRGYRVRSSHGHRPYSTAIIDAVNVVRTGERESITDAAKIFKPFTSKQVNASVNSRRVQLLHSRSK